MSEVWNLCHKLVKEINRINSFKLNKDRMSKEDFKKLINGYIDLIWK